MHVAAGAKGGKMRALSYKLQEVLDLLPIAWESGARIFLATTEPETTKESMTVYSHEITFLHSIEHCFNPRYIQVRYLQQLLDEVQQNIAICQWQADQLYIFRGQRLRQIIDLRDTDKSRYLG